MKNWTRRHLPSLNSFATFEVAAKHLSFTIAAAELNVTQAAVSQKIKYLERSLEQQLFVRRHTSLELTNEGKNLLQAISEGLNLISSAVAEIKHLPKSSTITCSATVAVAQHWLKPIIDDFTELYPECQFVVLASDEDDTLRNFDEVDLSII